MILLAVGDHVEFANDEVRRTPKGTDIRLRPPTNVQIGERGIVKQITKTGGGGSSPLALGSAPISSLPPPVYWPPDLWFIVVEFEDGRLAILLSGWLRKLNLLEVLAWASQ